ncbi:hypothetical protein SB717_36730, partial [Priestia sp. SIMBA_032]|uniref:hypothetical protein n=1 Tax=Priestia sp. SIMBA_032 TaxID=3085775 RepID=UPI00397D4451
LLEQTSLYDTADLRANLCGSEGRNAPWQILTDVYDLRLQSQYRHMHRCRLRLALLCRIATTQHQGA